MSHQHGELFDVLRPWEMDVADAPPAREQRANIADRLGAL
jgi:hypothetical protein